MSALIDRLDGVKKTGTDRWIAKCPAHDDKSPSLALRLTDDGTWLVKCFSGCGAADVVAAVGLSLSDLFPEKPEGHYRKPTKHRISASDLLKIVTDESLAVGVIAGRFLDHREISEDEWSRLAVAVQRIRGARSYAPY